MNTNTLKLKKTPQIDANKQELKEITIYVHWRPFAVKKDCE